MNTSSGTHLPNGQIISSAHFNPSSIAASPVSPSSSMDKLSNDKALDEDLLRQIGKVYKERHTQAIEEGNDEMKHKMQGAMVAIKQVIEMMQERQGE